MKKHLAAMIAGAVAVVGVSAGSANDISPMIIRTVTIEGVESPAYYSVVEQRYRFVMPSDAGETAEEQVATLAPAMQ